VNDLLEQLRKIFADNYRVDEELKGGGMSRLFLATDLSLNRKVVIKILPPELTSDMMAARFKRESEVTAHLQHPNILPIITAGVRDGLMFYVMPFISGESLRERLKREGQLPITDALKIAGDVAGALAYAHSHGVVHRDIKPENILISNNQEIVADFGIARAASLASSLAGGPASKASRAQPNAACAMTALSSVQTAMAATAGARKAVAEPSISSRGAPRAASAAATSSPATSAHAASS